MRALIIIITLYAFKSLIVINTKPPPQKARALRDNDVHLSVCRLTRVLLLHPVTGLAVMQR